MWVWFDWRVISIGDFSLSLSLLTFDEKKKRCRTTKKNRKSWWWSLKKLVHYLTVKNVKCWVIVVIRTCRDGRECTILSTLYSVYYPRRIRWIVFKMCIGIVWRSRPDCFVFYKIVTCQLDRTELNSCCIILCLVFSWFKGLAISKMAFFVLLLLLFFFFFYPGMFLSISSFIVSVVWALSVWRGSYYICFWFSLFRFSAGGGKNK